MLCNVPHTPGPPFLCFQARSHLVYIGFFLSASASFLPPKNLATRDTEGIDHVCWVSKSHHWEPGDTRFRQLCFEQQKLGDWANSAVNAAEQVLPFPLMMPHNLDNPPRTLGPLQMFPVSCASRCDPVRIQSVGNTRDTQLDKPENSWQLTIDRHMTRWTQLVVFRAAISL
ncbi:hypothetical protein LZ32DRAFT_31982 [Colletotrichum eremochloae]|nr:hypothetical protein LZ32DRAFT_31982 [Colletotrichum eremochloae]